jgi:hypothetical protein
MNVKFHYGHYAMGVQTGAEFKIMILVQRSEPFRRRTG